MNVKVNIYNISYKLKLNILIGYKIFLNIL